MTVTAGVVNHGDGRGPNVRSDARGRRPRRSDASASTSSRAGRRRRRSSRSPSPSATCARSVRLAERRARARQRVQLRRVAGGAGARHPRRASGRAARREPVPGPRAGASASAAVRGHRPANADSLSDDDLHARVGRRAERRRRWRRPPPIGSAASSKAAAGCSSMPASAPLVRSGRVAAWRSRQCGRPERGHAGAAGRARVRPPGVRGVPRAADRGLRGRAVLRLSRACTANPGSQVLARFDDGAPALLERKSGNGRVLMWTSSLDTFWNDLAVQPVYLPFMHRAAALPRRLQRAAAVAHGRGGRRRPGR